MRARGWATPIVLAVGAVLLVAACGSSSSDGAGTSPSGQVASPQAKMICADEAVVDVADALLIKTVAKPKASWTGEDFTCTYRYAAGAQIVLKVRDLPSDAAAATYLAGLGRTLHRTSKEITFGTDGAFAVPDGSVAVQKDSHVLFVDVSGLPKSWADPPLKPNEAASIVAAAIMGCWTGDG